MDFRRKKSKLWKNLWVVKVKKYYEDLTIIFTQIYLKYGTSRIDISAFK